MRFNQFAAYWVMLVSAMVVAIVLGCSPDSGDNYKQSEPSTTFSTNHVPDNNVSIDDSLNLNFDKSISEKDEDRLLLDQQESLRSYVNALNGKVLRGCQIDCFVDLTHANTDVTDVNIYMIMEFPRCYGIYASSNQITDCTIEAISNCEVFSIFSFPNSQVTDHGIARLCKDHPELNHINISNCQNLTDEALYHIAGLEHLEVLYINNCTFSDDALKGLSRSPKLIALYADHLLSLTYTTVDYLTQLPLKKLSLAGANINKRLLEKLQELSTLEELQISDSPIKGDAVYVLKSMNLKKISFVDCKNLTNQDLSAILPSYNLTHITLDNLPNVSGEILPHILNCPNLESLRLNGIILKPKDIQLFDDFKKVNSIRLENIPLPENAIDFMPKYLHQLTLINCGLDDESLLSIKRMRAIQYLSVRDNKDVTDKSISVFVELNENHEAPWPIILDLKGTSVSPEGIRTLLEHCPKLRISTQ